MSVDFRMIEAVESASSLEALEAVVTASSWGEYLRALSVGEDTEAEIASLRSTLSRARTRLSPEHSSAELQALKAAVYDVAPAEAESASVRPLLERIAALRTTLPLRAHARLFGRLEAQLSREFAWMNGGTGYSNRARRAQSLFTRFAGQTHIAGAETDRHGNALGTDYDLGQDGAFAGFTVHVLQLYCGEGFTFAQPTQAFARKGFAVERRTHVGTVAELEAWLAEAQQLWLISDARSHLSAAHVAVIQAFWARGGALYLWGDNEPFYVDANAVSQALFGAGLEMKGDLIGNQIVHERSTEGGRGFLPHLITTGLVHLYEGITIASLSEASAAAEGFVPLLYGSAGNLVTVVRDADERGGPVMIDTAFTRLYCQWDDAGTARYVCNAACFLAASVPAAHVAEDTASADADADEVVEASLVAEGAFSGVCDLSGRPSAQWMVLSVTAQGDALKNTSDLVLNDPLCAGPSNLVFSEALYSEEMGQWLLNLEPERRRDPLTKAPVVACLPLVDLSHAQNLRAFTDILCVVLMDGKVLPSAAQQVFFAVVDEMLLRPELSHRDAWLYLYRQCLQHVRTTRDFTAMGEKVPLLEAMASLFSPATDERLPLRRSFQSVGVMGRTLLRESRAAPETVRRIARRALTHVILRSALAAEKAAPGSVPQALHGLLYDTFHGIPRLQSGRLITQRPAFVMDVTLAEQRLADALGVSVLLSVEEQTAILYAMLSHDLRQFSAESLVERLRAESLMFSVLFDSATPVTDLEVVAELNARFAAYAEGVDPTDPHLSQAVPFATTWGPSVYRCVCGHAFGDPTQPLTDETLDALRAERVAHFRAVYRVRSSSPQIWYPEAGSLHTNRHRAVQSVLRTQFTDATAFAPEMVPAVAAYLLQDGKGFLCDPHLEERIRETLDSYLALRRAGQPHPEGLMTLEIKARKEQEAVLRARQRPAPALPPVEESAAGTAAAAK